MGFSIPNRVFHFAFLQPSLIGSVAHGLHLITSLMTNFIDLFPCQISLVKFPHGWEALSRVEVPLVTWFLPLWVGFPHWFRCFAHWTGVVNVQMLQTIVRVKYMAVMRSFWPVYRSEADWT
ncbi:hypothetical protein TNCV_63191 [Trichonephila clavipes]|nr:hypothetical protein TNCV_63191 [Trichonephila clavipes]